MRSFYLAYPNILQIVSAKSGDESKEKTPMLLGQSSLGEIANRFPLSWSLYVKLMSVKNPKAREFYEAEALRSGWSVRQLTRQINSMFYERTALSRNKAAMLRKGQKPLPEDVMTPQEEIKDPFVLEVRCDSKAVSLTKVRKNSEGGSWVNQFT